MATRSQVAKAYALLLGVLFTSGAQGQRAHLPEVSLPDEIVVYGPQDIVVNGRARKCRPIAGDPLSKVNLSSSLLGSGLVDYSQKMTVAARAMAEKKAVGQRS